MFWIQFEALCASCGKSPNAVAAELGIPSGSITAWSKGTQPRNSTVKKIADYFSVTVQYLLFGETSDPGIKKAPPTGGALEAVSDLPSDVQNLIEICKGNPELTTALLNLAQQIEKSRSRPE